MPPGPLPRQQQANLSYGMISYPPHGLPGNYPELCQHSTSNNFKHNPVNPTDSGHSSRRPGAAAANPPTGKKKAKKKIEKEELQKSGKNLKQVSNCCTQIIFLNHPGTPTRSFNATDMYICIGESTASKSLYKFCEAVIALYGTKYLRDPNKDDVKRLLAIGKDHGFPSILG